MLINKHANRVTHNIDQHHPDADAKAMEDVLPTYCRRRSRSTQYLQRQIQTAREHGCRTIRIEHTSIKLNSIQLLEKVTHFILNIHICPCLDEQTEWDPFAPFDSAMERGDLVLRGLAGGGLGREERKRYWGSEASKNSDRGNYGLWINNLRNIQNPNNLLEN